MNKSRYFFNFILQCCVVVIFLFFSFSVYAGFWMYSPIITQVANGSGGMSTVQDDGDDIRFGSGDTPYSYWLETWTTNGTATAWVKCPSLVAGITTLYLYYNDTVAVSASNGFATFLFFDDFNDGVISSAWQTIGGAWIESEGLLKQTSNAASTIETGAIVLAPTFTTGYAVAGNVRSDGNYFGRVGLIGAAKQDATYGVLGLRLMGEYSALESLSLVQDHIVWEVYGAGGVNEKTWYKFELRIKPDGTRVGNANGISLSSAYTARQGDYVGVAAWSAINPAGVAVNASMPASFDNFRIRKFVDPEPTVSIGAEEANPGNIYPTFLKRRPIQINSSVELVDYQVKIDFRVKTVGNVIIAD